MNYLEGIFAIILGLVDIAQAVVACFVGKGAWWTEDKYVLFIETCHVLEMALEIVLFAFVLEYSRSYYFD